jgi:hypothetical protein
MHQFFTFFQLSLELISFHHLDTFGLLLMASLLIMLVRISPYGRWKRSAIVTCWDDQLAKCYNAARLKIITSPARYFLLLKIWSYTSNFFARVAVCCATAAGSGSWPANILIVNSKFCVQAKKIEENMLFENQFHSKTFSRWIELRMLKGASLFKSAHSFNVTVIRN